MKKRVEIGAGHGLGMPCKRTPDGEHVSSLIIKSF